MVSNRVSSFPSRTNSFRLFEEGAELKTRLLCGKEEGNNRSVGIVRVDLNRAGANWGASLLKSPLMVFRDHENGSIIFKRETLFRK